MWPRHGAGLLILLTIIVITTNLRLIVENILKYGVLTRPQAWVLALVPRSNPLLLLAWAAMAACILMAWAVETIGCNRLRAERKVTPETLRAWSWHAGCAPLLRFMCVALSDVHQRPAPPAQGVSSPGVCILSATPLFEYPISKFMGSTKTVDVKNDHRRDAAAQGSTARRKRDLRPSDARRLAAQMRHTTEWALFVLNLANTSAVLLVPCGLVTATRADILPGFLVTISAVILWLKLVSYAHCNYDLRRGCLPMLPGPSYVPPPAVWAITATGLASEDPDVHWEIPRNEEAPRLQVTAGRDTGRRVAG